MLCGFWYISWRGQHDPLHGCEFCRCQNHGSDTCAAGSLTKDMMKSSRAQMKNYALHRKLLPVLLPVLQLLNLKAMLKILDHCFKEQETMETSAMHNKATFLYLLMLPRMLFHLTTEIKIFMCLHKLSGSIWQPSVPCKFLCTHAPLTWLRQVIHLRAL